MLSLEQEIKEFLKLHGTQYQEGCNEFDELDFCIHSQQRGDFHFDAKEKIQNIQPANWPDIGVPEEFFFILDDLAARKTLLKSPRSGIVVRDNLNSIYYFFSIVDLFLMPRVRVNRRIERNIPTLKGKWLVDLRNGTKARNLQEVFKAIAQYTDSFDEIFQNTLECYGSYNGEIIGQGGITRRPEHWNKDVSSTR